MPADLPPIPNNWLLVVNFLIDDLRPLTIPANYPRYAPCDKGDRIGINASWGNMSEHFHPADFSELTKEQAKIALLKRALRVIRRLARRKKLSAQAKLKLMANAAAVEELLKKSPKLPRKRRTKSA